MAELDRKEQLRIINEKIAESEAKLEEHRIKANRKLKVTEHLQFKIAFIVTSILLVTSLCLSALCVSMAGDSVNEALNAATQPTALVAAALVEEKINYYLSESYSVANNAIMTLPDVPEASKNVLFKQFREKTGAITSNGFNPQGQGAPFTIDQDILDRLNKGETIITSPEYDHEGNFIFRIYVPVTNSFMLMYSSAFEEQVVGGLVFAFDAKGLTDLLTDINIGANGTAYMIDSKGVTIASTSDYSLVTEQVNSSLDPTSDPALIAAEKEMIAGKSGIADYKMDGQECTIAYAPVGNTGWSVAVDIYKSDFQRRLNINKYISYGVTALFAAISAIIVFIYLKKFTNPITTISESSKRLAEGDFSVEVDVKLNDEVGILADSFALTVDNLNATISDIKRVLYSLGQKDFRVFTEVKYVGDFEEIETSIREVRDNVSSALSQIQQIGAQVSEGSEQVSSGAQSLAQGATEQAASIEELSATINEIYEMAKKNTEAAVDASQKMSTAGNGINDSNEQMRRLMEAMDIMTEKSEQIGKIVKAIDDIAFQTNILALNAAVEAARAGAAGKGFAVVADEVRNLASKSAEAVQTTTILIEETTKAIQDGSAIAHETAETLNKVVEMTNSVVTVVEDIRTASEQQTSAVSQATVGVEQISAVVQTNSATSEESAAAAQELNNQVAVLESLINEFTI